MNIFDSNPSIDHDSDPDDEPDPGSAGIAVEVSDTQSHIKIDPEEVVRLVRGALAAEGVRRASISVALVDDATIHAINRRHLDHDWPTDVISFGLSDPDEAELSGELVVSAETAAATARRAGVPARDELALYVVHGSLHLCGHDDSTAEGRGLMRRREGEILAALGLSNTFATAVPETDRAGDAGAPTGSEAVVEGRLRGEARWSG